MANIIQYGFRPAEGTNNIVVKRFLLDGTENSTRLAVGDVVMSTSGGGLNAATAGIGLGLVGVVVGLYDANGIPIGHPMSTVSTKYLTASVAGYADVALALSGAFFVAQSLSTSYARTDIWTVAALVATACDTTTGHSQHKLGATGGADFLLVQEIIKPNNSLGSANCDMLVHFNKSMFGLGTGAAV
jgi:hypothetical protein